jgi:hypothetical protein
MSTKSNQVKAEQLGMPHGTATGRLKKAMMFLLLQRLGEDICFKCGKRIQTAAELSMEHKKPWLYSDDPVGHFFDLDNVAFSHLRCNRPDRPSGPNRKQVPDGMRWCSGCQQPRDLSKFGSRNKGRRGCRGYCNECRARRGWDHQSRTKKKVTGVR